MYVFFLIPCRRSPSQKILMDLFDVFLQVGLVAAALLYFIGTDSGKQLNVQWKILTKSYFHFCQDLNDFCFSHCTLVLEILNCYLTLKYIYADIFIHNQLIV